jgi:hypothetical protein
VDTDGVTLCVDCLLPFFLNILKPFPSSSRLKHCLYWASCPPPAPPPLSFFKSPFTRPTPERLHRISWRPKRSQLIKSSFSPPGAAAVATSSQPGGHARRPQQSYFCYFFLASHPHLNLLTCDTAKKFGQIVHSDIWPSLLQLFLGPFQRRRPVVCASAARPVALEFVCRDFLKVIT